MDLNLASDGDGYPTDETLLAIEGARVCSYADCAALLQAVRTVWLYADQGYWAQHGELYTVATAGWSGNESIVSALQGNLLFWGLCWQASERGGHHTFKVPVGGEP